MDDARSPFGIKEKKKRRRVVQYARCPHCWERVVVPEDKDPDRVVEVHAKNDCWWVARHGFSVHPSKRIESKKVEVEAGRGLAS
jgi:hypothetical protein